MDRSEKRVTNNYRVKQRQKKRPAPQGGVGREGRGGAYTPVGVGFATGLSALRSL